ncbi:MAG: outer membrane scaffolding protein for murein synthesis (MipA/OmpV family) [Pseudohongiellaceae bacterium]|jgi:outer membrane scaffolding protein for murein synthesis (MipA/OmpV family)
MKIKPTLMMVKGSCVKLRLILVALITYLLVTNTALADFEQRTNTDIFSIGFGAKVYSGPYSGQDGYVEPFPLIHIQQGRFFLKDYTIGFHFYNHKRVSLALAGNYNREFLDVDEINDKNKRLYYGIEDRDPSTEVGFIGRFYSRVGLVEGTFFKDVSDTHDGTRASLRISRPIPDTGKWTMVPSFYVNYYSEKFNNYYYGVTQKENDNGEEIALADGTNEIAVGEFGEKIRSTYSTGNTGHVGFALDMKYSFTQSIKAVGNIAIEKFAGEVETSPLTEDKQLITAVIGLAYEF